MASSPVKLAYVAAQFRVKAELTKRICVATSEAPDDLIVRAQNKLQSVEQAGEIASFVVYQKEFKQCWAALKAHPEIGIDEKIIFTLAEGAQVFPELQVTLPAQKDKAACELNISDLQACKNWRLDSFIYHINKKMNELGSTQRANQAQIHGALLRAQNGLEIVNFPLAEIAQTSTPEEKAAKPYSILANKNRGEVVLILRNLWLICKKAGIDKMVDITEEAVEKVSSQLGVKFYFLRKDLHTSLTNLASGPELLDIFMPTSLLVGTTIKQNTQSSSTQSGDSANSKVFNTAYPGAGKLSISISENGLKAFVQNFDTSIYADTSFKKDKEWVRNELRRNGLSEEAFTPYFDDLVATLNAKETLEGKTCAIGFRSKGGARPFLQSSVDSTNQESSEKINIRDMQQKSIVRPGQLIATINYKEAPIIGKDVLGNDLEPAANEELDITIGEGVQKRGANKFYSTTEGVPIVEKTSISISRIMTHKGDVNLRTGNIVFEGPVEITGSVDRGAVIDVGGDLTIGGNVSGALIRCGGNLKVKNGIVTGDHGLVFVEGDIEAEFIENSKVQCGGNITVKKIIINSNVISGCSIEVQNELDGIIAGGTISCRQNLITAHLGFKHGNMTNISVGVDWKAELAVRIRTERLEKVKEKNQEDRMALREVMGRSKAQMTAKHNQRKDYYQARLVKTRTLIEKMEQHLEKAKKNLVYDPSTIIFVKQTVHPNVNINIGGSLVTLKTDMTAVGILGKRKHGSYVVPIDVAKDILKESA